MIRWDICAIAKKKIDEGYDVRLWLAKRIRQDKLFTRKIPSIARPTRMISWIGGVPLPRITAVRLRLIVSRVPRRCAALWRDASGFIPIYASWFGARRVHGKFRSNIMARTMGTVEIRSVPATIKVVFDLMTIKFHGVVSDETTLRFRVGGALLTLIVSLFLAPVLAFLMKFVKLAASCRLLYRTPFCRLLTTVDVGCWAFNFS